MRITGTFLNPAGGDIPAQNWGVEQWKKDFEAMNDIGIDTVIFYSGGRCGGVDWVHYPSDIMSKEYGAFGPYINYVELFLQEAEKYNMRAFIAPVDLHLPDRSAREQLSKRLIKELWSLYGSMKAFQGWYLPKEISHNVGTYVDEYIEISKYCKEVSNGLPVLVSPGMLGRKAWLPNEPAAKDLDYEKHERDFDAVFSRLKGWVDIVAFQDGHVDYWQLPEALRINKKLADKYGMESWTNAESFDRDTGKIRFPPIRCDKLFAKLRMAKEAGVTKAITWEFSTFMSPNSEWGAARNLHQRYKEYFNL